ncbi:MAG: hypothetical protein ACPG4Z_02475 [Chitinophagales bacterium]
MKNKIIFIGFLVLPFYMMIQFAFALVVREPYPAFMMPGFSKIDNNQETYILKDKEINVQFEDNSSQAIQLKELASPFSKIAISRTIDLAFFNTSSTKSYNSAQQKYYSLIENAIGTKNYEKYILAVRHPEMSLEEIDLFSTWIIEKIERSSQKQVEILSIVKMEYTRDFKTGEILQTLLIDEIEIQHD